MHPYLQEHEQVKIASILKQKGQRTK